MKTGCVAFAFGGPSNTKANQRIAQMACQINITSHPGIYTQMDVDIKTLPKDGYRDRMVVTYTVERPGYPPPTLRIARGAVDWAMSNNVSKLHIACAYPHLWRCKRDMSLAILERNARLKIKICPEARGKKGWFCKDCTQSRARLRWLWYTREIIIRLMPVWLYKKIAS